MMDRKIPARRLSLLLLASLLVAGIASAETLETLDASLSNLMKERSALQREYDRELKVNHDRSKRIASGTASETDLRAAYAAAARLEQMNARLQESDLRRQELCAQWRRFYRSTVDSLLAQAEKERDGRKKADAGRRLQNLQSRNAELCPELAPAATLEWRSLQVQPHDGPQEIEQKVQLLKDIEREMTIRLKGLEDRYERAKREQRTRDRAQEFIQEGTLFEERVSVRGPSTDASNPRSTDQAPALNPGGSEYAGSGATTDGGGTPEMRAEWPLYGDPKAMEEAYGKRRQDLLRHQNEVQQKIREFEQAARSLLQP